MQPAEFLRPAVADKESHRRGYKPTLRVADARIRSPIRPIHRLRLGLLLR